MICRICGTENDGPIHLARERMFGLGGEFAYWQCSGCNCLQLKSPPEDISVFYPPAYYSFHAHSAAAFGLSPARFRQMLTFYFAGYGITPETRILDVGCGSGQLLTALTAAGFQRCSGVDRYIAGDKRLSNGLTIRKAGIDDVEPEWDMVMFNHSFEHLADPAGTLRRVSKLLSNAGVCLIRMPAIPCYAWDRYGVDWVQLDAPRHFFVHSIASLSYLAKAAGLRVVETRYDSTSFQFWGSELYRGNHSLALSNRPLRSLFSDTNLRDFDRLAAQLNRDRKGDQAAFYLRKY